MPKIELQFMWKGECSQCKTFKHNNILCHECGKAICKECYQEGDFKFVENKFFNKGSNFLGHFCCKHCEKEN